MTIIELRQKADQVNSLVKELEELENAAVGSVKINVNNWSSNMTMLSKQTAECIYRLGREVRMKQIRDELDSFLKPVEEPAKESE